MRTDLADDLQVQHEEWPAPHRPSTSFSPILNRKHEGASPAAAVAQQPAPDASTVSYFIHLARSPCPVAPERESTGIFTGPLVLSVASTLPACTTPEALRPWVVCGIEKGNFDWVHYLPSPEILSDFPSRGVEAKMLGILVSCVADKGSICPVTRRLKSAIDELIVTTLCRGNSPGLESLRNFVSIRSVVRKRLGDAALNPKEIAELAGLSLVFTHRLLSQGRFTLMEAVWNERLDACAADLWDERYAHDHVSTIAFKWGFKSMSHFSRAFKARFSTTPSDWRQSASHLRGISAKPAATAVGA